MVTFRGANHLPVGASAMTALRHRGARSPSAPAIAVFAEPVSELTAVKLTAAQCDHGEGVVELGSTILERGRQPT